jgi:hypothetical protein
VRSERGRKRSNDVSISFVFKTDRLEKSSCGFAVMGEELNGRYYYASKS